MAIYYDFLFHLMIDKQMNNTQLKEKAGFSTNIVTLLKRSESVSIKSIERICCVLECGMDNILEFVLEAKKRKKHEPDFNVSEKAILFWAIAKKLTGVYKSHEYGEVILPPHGNPSFRLHQD